MAPITIVCSTNRIGAYTRTVSDIYAAILREKGQECHILDLKDLPPDFIFTAMFDKRGGNEGFNAIQQMVNESKKFVFIVPEYNGSYPGVLKAFFDGLRFPDSFKEKAGAIIGLSSGSMGGALAISHLTDVLNYLGMFVLPIKPRLPGVHKIIKDNMIQEKLYLDLLHMQADQLIAFHCHV